MAGLAFRQLVLSAEEFSVVRVTQSIANYERSSDFNKPTQILLLYLLEFGLASSPPSYLPEPRHQASTACPANRIDDHVEGAHCTMSDLKEFLARPRNARIAYVGLLLNHARIVCAHNSDRCRLCHARKVKCSGGMPCTNCYQANSSAECTYPSRNRRIRVEQKS